jgi:hypothetical protein
VIKKGNVTPIEPGRFENPSRLILHRLWFGLLSVTTFWSFLREFSPLEVCGDENNRAPLSGELPIGLHVPLHLSIGQAHAGDGRISSECELWKSFLHHHICGSRLHRENSTGISLNLRISHGKVARTRAENSRMS